VPVLFVFTHTHVQDNDGGLYL